jgi:hypothetical protein
MTCREDLQHMSSGAIVLILVLGMRHTWKQLLNQEVSTRSRDCTPTFNA